MQSPAPDQRRTKSNRLVAAVCVAFFGGMVGMAYAAVPLYDMFCKITGYGGTTQRVEQYSDRILDREIAVRFERAPRRSGVGPLTHPTNVVMSSLPDSSTGDEAPHRQSTPNEQNGEIPPESRPDDKPAGRLRQMDCSASAAARAQAAPRGAASRAQNR